MNFYDVEMVGKTGRCCHVFVTAENGNQAAKLAQQYFPELELTGNTVEVNQNNQK